MIKAFINELVNDRLSLVVQKWVIDRTPHIFGTDQHNYVLWKSKLAEKIEVDGRAIALIGSASIGFSLNPDKNYRKFDDGSDIDVAIVSAHHFELAWHTIRNLGALRHGLTSLQQNSLEDHRSRLIYWGTFDTKHLLPRLPFGKQWFEAFEQMTAESPTRDREINARIYRDFESLSAYHVNNLNILRTAQL
jgi:hypothetical protein